MREIKCDLHIHTVFCDGIHIPEEMVLQAISMGMETVGFSAHSPVRNDSTTMSAEREAEYQTEIRRLGKVYQNQIRVLCGLEQDFYADTPAVGKGYDYLIGSVHMLPIGKSNFQLIDISPENLTDGVKRFWGGDIYRLLADYYETVASLPEKTGCDIIGHFDLVEKFNEGERLFSRKDVRYRKVALDALDALLAKDVIFEINTGAVSRGYRTAFYPDSFLLRRIAEKRGRVILSSDAHRKESLMSDFCKAVDYAHACGVGGLTVYGKNGFETIGI